jgi:hypothetical protein
MLLRKILVYKIPLGPHLKSSLQVDIQPKRKEPPSNPLKFQGAIELNPKLLKEDDNITCIVTLNQLINDQKLEWYLNDQLIILNDHFPISFDGLHLILTIKKIRPDDSR